MEVTPSWSCVLLLCCSDQRRRGSHAFIHPSVEAKKADDRDRGCPLGSIQLAFSYSPQTPALLVTLTDIMLLSSKVLFSGESWVWSRESWCGLVRAGCGHVRAGCGLVRAGCGHVRAGCGVGMYMCAIHM